MWGSCRFDNAVVFSLETPLSDFEKIVILCILELVSKWDVFLNIIYKS